MKAADRRMWVPVEMACRPRCPSERAITRSGGSSREQLGSGEKGLIDRVGASATLASDSLSTAGARERRPRRSVSAEFSLDKHRRVPPEGDDINLLQLDTT